jgi:hypothetical protein
MTQDLKLPKGIKRITVVKAVPGGSIEAVVVYRPEEKKQKKQSRELRLLERWARRSAGASRLFGETYAERHRRSNRKKRDGWLRDLAFNLFKANGKASKKSFGW